MDLVCSEGLPTVSGIAVCPGLQSTAASVMHGLRSCRALSPRAGKWTAAAIHLWHGQQLKHPSQSILHRTARSVSLAARSFPKGLLELRGCLAGFMKSGWVEMASARFAPQLESPHARLQPPRTCHLRSLLQRSFAPAPCSIAAVVIFPLLQ